MKRLLGSEVKSIQRMAHFLTGCRLSQIMHNLGPSIARHLRRCNLTWIGGNSRSNIPTSHFRRMRLRLVAVGFFLGALGEQSYMPSRMCLGFC